MKIRENRLDHKMRAASAVVRIQDLYFVILTTKKKAALVRCINYGLQLNVHIP